MSRAADVTGRVDLRELWPVLFGHELRRGRGRAVYRGGDGFSVKVTSRSAKDYVTGESYDILGAIELAHGGTRVNALAWLADHLGMGLDKASTHQAQRLAERRERARDRASELIAWRDDKLILALRDVRNYAWTEANQIDRLTIGADANDAAVWGLIAQAVRRREIGDAIEGYIVTVKAMTGAELVNLRASLEGGAPC